MTTSKQILRWFAVLPGALLGAIIVMFPVHWVAMYIHHFGTPDPIITDEQGRGLLQSMPLESLERFGDALFVPGALVAAGAFIAPRFHFATAIALILLEVSFMSWVYISASSMDLHINDSPFRMVVTAVLWLVSLGIALHYARDLDKGC